MSRRAAAAAILACASLTVAATSGGSQPLRAEADLMSVAAQPERAVFRVVREPEPTTTTTAAPPPTTTTTEAPPPETTTTHTHPPPPTTAAPAPQPQAQAASAPAGGGRCGGWEGLIASYFPDEVGTACRVMMCESGGSPTIHNRSSSASGLWQFLDSTWQSTTGTPGPAANYSAETQTAAAAKLRNSSGWGQWSCY